MDEKYSDTSLEQSETLLGHSEVVEDLEKQSEVTKTRLFTLKRILILILALFTTFSFVWYTSYPTYTAVACMDVSIEPMFIPWEYNNVTYEEMTRQVYDTVLDMWKTQEYSTRTLFNETLGVRVTESNMHDVPRKTQIEEAIMQALTLAEGEIPDAACVFGHEDNGGKFGFVWGSFDKKVEELECTSEQENAICMKVDNSFFL